MGHEMRWGGLAGFGAVVAAVAGRIVFGAAPAITASSDVIAAYLTAHRNQIMTGSLLYAVAVVLAVWFGAALATAFRRANGSSDAPAAVLGGFVLVASVGFVVVSVVAGMTYAITAHPQLQAVAAGPYTALTVVGTIAGIAAALPLAASAAAIMHTHVFPVWMGWFAGLAAAVRVLSAFTAGISGGVLAPGGVLVTYLPAALSGLWVLAASWLLIREHLPVPATRMPGAAGHA